MYHDSPLSRLRDAHVSGCWNYMPLPISSPLARQRFDDFQYYFSLSGSHIYLLRLPSLQKLSFFDLHTEKIASLLRTLEIAPRSSSITHLTLTFHSHFRLLGPDILALLSFPRALISLSMHWHSGAGKVPESRLSNAGLWDAIQQYAESLEYLDIFRQEEGKRNPGITDTTHFGCLWNLKRLQHLRVQPEVLLGIYEGSRAPFQIKDTISPSLKSLALHGADEYPELGQRLQEALSSTTFPQLRHVVLESTLTSHGRGDSNLQAAAERVCNAVGTAFEPKFWLSCSRGGWGCRYYRDVRERRELMGRKMQGATWVVARCLNPTPGVSLSIEDLETYEIPWDEFLVGGLDAVSTAYRLTADQYAMMVLEERMSAPLFASRIQGFPRVNRSIQDVVRVRGLSNLTTKLVPQLLLVMRVFSR